MITLLSFLFTLIAFPQEPFLRLDRIIDKAVLAETLPGGVSLVGSRKGILQKTAYGKRDLRSNNSTETIYDLASLTKVVATTTAVMILEQEQKLSLTDKVSQYFPEFMSDGKDHVTIEDLMRHRSGLQSGLRPFSGEAFGDYFSRILELPLAYVTGAKTVYSDLNFILLGVIVERVSGATLREFTHTRIFGPLKMTQTDYGVPPTSEGLCAPTLPARKCLPHDPTAYHFFPRPLGHAGVFSTADDLGRFAQMYLNGGELDGVRILKADSVKKMITLPVGEIRGLGWDLLSPYATAPRGDVFPPGISYGHTGYTGTSLWLDPQSGGFYVFLSNRVLLGEEATAKPFTALRHAIATAIGDALYGKGSL